MTKIGKVIHGIHELLDLDIEIHVIEADLKLTDEEKEKALADKHLEISQIIRSWK